MPFSRDPNARQTYATDTAFAKGKEMGWFEHGSTIIVLAPEGFAFADGVAEGSTIRMGTPLMRLPQALGPIA
jgi:phosphatidylserine decarboxylase